MIHEKIKYRGKATRLQFSEGVIVDSIDRSVDRLNDFSRLSRPNATSRARVTTCLRSNPAAIGKYRAVSMRHTRR